MVSGLSQILGYFFKHWLKSFFKLVFLLAIVWFALDFSAGWYSSFNLDESGSAKENFKSQTLDILFDVPVYTYNWVHPGLDIYDAEDISPEMNSVYSDLHNLLTDSSAVREKTENWRVHQADKIASKYDLDTNEVMEIYVKVYNVKN